MAVIPPNARSNALTIVYLVLTGLSGLVVALRFIARKKASLELKQDDWLILLAWFFSLGVFIPGVYAHYHGSAGRHITEIAPEQARLALKAIYFYIVFYHPTVAFVKLSILFFYRRISPDHHFRQLIYAVIAIVVGFSIATSLVLIFQCMPIGDFWERPARARCIDRTKFYLAASSINMITDFMILILPLPMVWRLQLPRRQKLALSAVFLVGIVTCSASIIRITQLDLVITRDPTWNIFAPGLWTSIEINSALFCACFPAMRPLIKGLRRERLNNQGSPSYLMSETSKRSQPGSAAAGVSRHLAKSLGTGSHLHEDADVDEVSLEDTERARA